MAFKSVCIVGPGAIGGMLAVLLERAGYTMSALARPARAEAIRQHGLTLHMGGQTHTGRPAVASTASELGTQDLVVVTLKGGALRCLASEIAALCGPGTQVVFLMNGIPWWFFDGFGGPLAGTRLQSLDPDGELARALPAERVVWGVINCVVGEVDGAIVHQNMQQIELGRPNGQMDGLEEIAEVFRGVGYKTDAFPQLRNNIWVKLQANVTMNPVSALTMSTLDKVLTDPFTLELVIAIALETRAVGAKLGLEVGLDPTERLRTLGPKLNASKTSMLYDAERGRPLELDSLMAALVEIGALLDVPMPQTRAVYGLARLRSAALQAS
jgi:2-dehydropantoate 2-reductase